MATGLAASRAPGLAGLPKLRVPTEKGDIMPVSSETKDKLQKELERNDEVQITIIGRKSGRPITHIVWFVLEGNTLYFLPVKGSETQWFKNLLGRDSLKISAAGVQGEFRAATSTDPKLVSAVVKKFQAKHGASDVKKYYAKFDVAVVVNLE
jgi:hypothetical protein